MPVHDWTRVEDGIFHAFHTAWVTELQKALNSGVLPDGFYALAEQHAGRTIPDLLTLHASPAERDVSPASSISPTGGIATALEPPRVRRRETIEPLGLARRRSLAIRHVSGHRLVALLEIISPANKDRQSTVVDFATKVVNALDVGVSVLMIDLFPPGSFDPGGMHNVIRQRLDNSVVPYGLPADEPLTLASYAAGPRIEIYLEHLAVGERLVEMPLCLTPDRHVNTRLEATHQEAYSGIPGFWRGIIEGQEPTGG